MKPTHALYLPHDEAVLDPFTAEEHAYYQVWLRKDQDYSRPDKTVYEIVRPAPDYEAFRTLDVLYYNIPARTGDIRKAARKTLEWLTLRDSHQDATQWQGVLDGPRTYRHSQSEDEELEELELKGCNGWHRLANSHPIEIWRALKEEGWYTQRIYLCSDLDIIFRVCDTDTDVFPVMLERRGHSMVQIEFNLFPLRFAEILELQRSSRLLQQSIATRFTRGQQIPLNDAGEAVLEITIERNTHMLASYPYKNKYTLRRNDPHTGQLVLFPLTGEEVIRLIRALEIHFAPSRPIEQSDLDIITLAEAKRALVRANLYLRQDACSIPEETYYEVYTTGRNSAYVYVDSSIIRAIPARQDALARAVAQALAWQHTGNLDPDRLACYYDQL